MILNLFSVYDQKAQAYLPPFYLGQIGQATRIFTDCCNSKDHQFGAHPQDYTLFHLGEWDDNNCEHTIAAPQLLGNGVEFLKLELANTTEELRNEVSNDTPVQSNSAGDNPT